MFMQFGCSISCFCVSQDYKPAWPIHTSSIRRICSMGQSDSLVNAEKVPQILKLYLEEEEGILGQGAGGKLEDPREVEGWRDPGCEDASRGRGRSI